MAEYAELHLSDMKEDTLSFTPELLTESGKTSYRFRCPGPRVFQCALTGLVFVMALEAELLYNTVQWDEIVLRSAGKMAAGPLFEIKSSEEAAVHQLHLPHCETKDAPLPDGLLSVVHITDDGMSVLESQEITDTRAISTVPHLSAFGLVRDIVTRFSNNLKLVSGQVLLFLGPPIPETQRQKLNVLLLPTNIPLMEVSAQHQHCKNIQVPSTCKLIKDQSYTAHCPQAIKVQPKKAEFDLEYGPNYHPTFEIRLPTNTPKVTVTVRDERQTKVWEHDVDLMGSRGQIPQWSVPAEDNVPAEDRVPAEQRLFSVRRQFVSTVSDPILNHLLDELLERQVINDDEMQSARAKLRAEKARHVIDTVRNKGTEASSVLIAALCEVDPHLSRVLKLS